MMDKTAEIYRTPPADGALQTMDNPSALPAYTLFPDAGDPEILDTPVPLSLPPVPPPPSP